MFLHSFGQLSSFLHMDKWFWLLCLQLGTGHFTREIYLSSPLPTQHARLSGKYACFVSCSNLVIGALCFVLPTDFADVLYFFEPGTTLEPWHLAL